MHMHMYTFTRADKCTNVCVCICMLPVSQYVMRSMRASQLASRNIYGHTNRIYIHIRYKLADKWTDKQLDTERKR